MKNTSEYECLRSEIISMEEQQRNVWICMYGSFITLFVLGLEWSYYLFLVTYIILVPFQITINRYKWTVSKISTYIRVFYEDGSKKYNWESLHMFPDYREYYRKLNSTISGIIRFTGAVQLGFLSTIFFIGCLIREKCCLNMMNLTIVDMVLVGLSIFLLGLCIHINSKYNARYEEGIEEIIRKYKRVRKGEQEVTQEGAMS